MEGCPEPGGGDCQPGSRPGHELARSRSARRREEVASSMRVQTAPILFEVQPSGRGSCLLAIAFLLAWLSPAAAQQYPPPSYPSYPSYPGPGAAPPSYAPSYGGPAAVAPQAPPPPQYEAVPPPPPGPAMV